MQIRAMFARYRVARSKVESKGIGSMVSRYRVDRAHASTSNRKRRRGEFEIARARVRVRVRVLERQTGTSRTDGVLILETRVAFIHEEPTRTHRDTIRMVQSAE